MKRSEILALLNELTKGDPNATIEVEPIVEATSAPAWLTQAKAAVKANGKVKGKAATAKAVKTYVVQPSTFTDPKGGKHHGLAIVKMYNGEPDRRRPHGKFLTLEEVDAIKAFRG